jgi:peptidyl-prolyl cis-trans isomerase C
MQTSDATEAPKPQVEATPAADDGAQAVVKKLKDAGVEATISTDKDAPAPAAANNKPIELPEIVATVNGQNITKQQLQDLFNSALQASGAKIQDLDAKQQLGGYTQLLQDLIMDKLVSEAASSETVSDADVDAELAKIKGQFPDEKAFQEQITQSGMTPEKLKENIRTGLQQSRWMKSQVKADEVTEAQAKTFYDSNTKEFEQPETVKASHILFMVDADAPADVVKQKEEAAKKAAERAAAGEDFTKLAKELSEEPGAAESGGDLGFFPKDRMVPEFAEAAFAQKSEKSASRLKPSSGRHVIKVTDKKAPGTVPFDRVKEQIISYLKSTNQREAVQAVLSKLKESAKIETFCPRPAGKPHEQPTGKPAAGVIGLGIIGSRVAACLRRAGHPVWLWNRTVRPEPNFLVLPPRSPKPHATFRFSYRMARPCWKF